MLDSIRFKLYAQDEATEDSRGLRAFFIALCNLDGLLKLLEIRVEELERRLSQLKTAVHAYNFPEVIDDRSISVFIKGERVDER